MEDTDQQHNLDVDVRSSIEYCISAAALWHNIDLLFWGNIEQPTRSNCGAEDRELSHTLLMWWNTGKTILWALPVR